jgi:4-hydroxybenzoate polyprenyltransferase
MIRKIGTVLEMIKIQHSIFALPWAFLGALYALGKIPALMPLLWILLAMVTARAAAMTFNRILDAKIDKENPRTQNRAIPQKKITKTFAGGFTLLMMILFLFSAYQLNELCLKLAPIALLVTFGYSYTKRFTSFCHFVLGLSLSMAPIGAWLAVRPEWHPIPLLFGLATLLWIAGADILYACEDFDFDRKNKIRSIPAAMGIRNGMILSAFCHMGTIGALITVGIMGNMGPVFHAGVGAIALLLTYEHWIVRPDDLRRVNQAFFQINGIISIAIFFIGLGDLWQRGFL